MKLLLSTLLLLFFTTFLFAQADTVYLENPSFEGIPNEGGGFNKGNQLPKGWFDCGFPNESPPDVHSSESRIHGVFGPAEHGNTYIGMVTRDNDTWERVGGKLSSKLVKGQCYKFSIALARSEVYLSRSQINKTPANYIAPITLRIYGGNRYCVLKKMLGESGLVRNSRWLTYSFVFQPEEDVNYLTFEAFYNTPTLTPYNGNLLMDNASELVKIPCDSAKLGRGAAAQLSEKEKAKYKKEYAEFKLKRKAEEVKRDSIYLVKQEQKAIVMADFNKLVAFTKLAGKSIKFEKKTTKLLSENFSVADNDFNAKSGLNEMFTLVKNNPKLSLLIGVKTKDGKSVQSERMAKLTVMARAAGLNEDLVLVRKKDRIKWEYPWDAENSDLVFYVFEPEN